MPGEKLSACQQGSRGLQGLRARAPGPAGRDPGTVPDPLYCPASAERGEATYLTELPDARREYLHHGRVTSTVYFKVVT